MPRATALAIVRSSNRRLAISAAVATAAAIAAPAFAGTSTYTYPSGPSAGQSVDLVTISISGSTAMRNFTTSGGITLLTPGTTVTLGGRSITASNAFNTNVQLAPNVINGATPLDSFPTGSTAVTSGTFPLIRFEWHEQGSVEGIRELVHSQIDNSLLPYTIYNPSAGNPTWINRGSTGAIGSAPDLTLGGRGFTLVNNTAGARNAGAQSAIQMAISDVQHRQGFSIAGTGAFNATPTSAGYGKGNPALASQSNVSGVGVSGARQQLDAVENLNMTTSKVDPATGANYTAGPWNTGGLNNLVSQTVAITATTFSANPGTGLEKLNRTDAQWLQTAGRLQNGADFNMTTRDVNSGTRNVAALNTGVDPSWAVGENDDGNTGDGTPASSAAQVSINSGIRFSGKTAGGNALRPTIQNSRMAVGTLSISDAQGSAGNGADVPSGSGATAATAGSSATPIRVLAYANSASDSGATFVQPSIGSIIDGSYAIWQNQTYVTVKDNTSANAAANWGDVDSDANTGIKGDGQGGVKFLRSNIFASNAQFPAPSVATAADALLAQGFLPPKFMAVTKTVDGVNTAVANPGQDAALTDALLTRADTKTYRNRFAVAPASAITTGTSAAIYGGASNAAFLPSGTVASGGRIAITASNYFFGDFNQDGSRDFADLDGMMKAQETLNGTGPIGASNLGTAWNQGNNNVKVPTATLPAGLVAITGQSGNPLNPDGTAGTTTGPQKGDLIVKGDFNSDGSFDGKDLYLFARGASLADSATATGLTAASGATFADRVRNPNAVLRKNAALDFLNTNASAAQKLQATASLTNDPTGANAFNKFDVNRDGVVSRTDASIVDAFIGEDYRLLSDVLSATIANNGTINPTLPQVPFNLVNAELTDDGVVRANGATSDFGLLRTALGTGKLLDGDANFDGTVNFDDLLKLAANYNTPGDRWSLGDFDLNGTVNFDDLLKLAANYNSTVPGGLGGDWALARAAVPEPTSLVAIGVAGAGLLSRRRRKAK
jgi:hypothetical protein